ncbi:MAG TPA: DUF2087 domain-containing protein [Dermatophilaceae bacterium]|nr:DUF2087 domain-containing protein [Dermatophilaceae bacterium]
MTSDADLKRLVRARMARTGESYTRARAALLAEQPPSRAARDTGTGGAADLATDAAYQPMSFYDKTIRSFFDGELLRSIPTRRRPRAAVLMELLTRFEAGRDYSEPEVNDVLRTAHDDVAYLRRELVDYRYLVRADGRYRVTDVLPERDASEAQEVPVDEARRLTALWDRDGTG